MADIALIVVAFIASQVVLCKVSLPKPLMEVKTIWLLLAASLLLAVSGAVCAIVGLGASPFIVLTVFVSSFLARRYRLLFDDLEAGRAI